MAKGLFICSLLIPIKRKAASLSCFFSNNNLTILAIIGTVLAFFPLVGIEAGHA
jgi:hypothetical protein